MKIIAGALIGVCASFFLASCAVYSSTPGWDWSARVVNDRAKAKKVTCATTIAHVIDGLTPCLDLKRAWAQKGKKKPRAKRGKRMYARSSTSQKYH